MYCFAKICCLCLQYNQDLNKLDDTDSNGLTFFEKLIVLMPGFEKLVKKSIPKYICRKCKRYLNKFFKFQQHCFKSYKLLESYVGQLDTNATAVNNSELSVIEDDLILIKEDMEECLKNMEIYIKVEDSSSNGSSSKEQMPEEEKSSKTSDSKESSPKPETSSCRKRTRECKKVSYNEEYDSDSMLSDSEVYFTKGAKRKAKARTKNEPATRKEDKTVVIPQNDVFAKDLTKTINDIITRLAADTATTTRPEEFQVEFKNSAGNTEQLSIYQKNDSVEVKFTKEEKMGYLKVCRTGDSFILTHNMSESKGGSDLTAEQLDPAEEVPKPATPDVWNCSICGEHFRSCYTLTKHVNNYMNFQEISCNICDKKFEHVADLKRHISIHSSAAKAGSSESLRVQEVASTAVVSQPEATSGCAKTNQYCEIQVVLSDIQENPVKSERSSSPEYQFHLSDDSDDDDFDNDTVILGSLGQDQDPENDFTDTRSPSPVHLSSEVLEFLEREEEVVENGIPLGSEETKGFNNIAPPEDVLPPAKEDSKKEGNNNGRSANQSNNKVATNGTGLNDSSSSEEKEKHLKVVINKTEVDDFIKNKSEGLKGMLERGGSRQSPRKQKQTLPNGRES